MLFRSFGSQEERRTAGGSAFLELQYCALPRSTPQKRITSPEKVEHWSADSLYVSSDDLNLFSREYGDLFECDLPLFGIGYYSPLQTEKLIAKIAAVKPIDHETLLRWLAKAKEQNGFYFLGL